MEQIFSKEVLEVLSGWKSIIGIVALLILVALVIIIALIKSEKFDSDKTLKTIQWVLGTLFILVGTTYFTSSSKVSIQKTLKGRVMVNGKPKGRIQVSIPELEQREYTNDFGNFEFQYQISGDEYDSLTIEISKGLSYWTYRFNISSLLDGKNVISLVDSTTQVKKSSNTQKTIKKEEPTVSVEDSDNNLIIVGDNNQVIRILNRYCRILITI